MLRLRASAIFQTTVVQYVILGLGLVNSLLLARLLGPEGRGELAAAMLWPLTLIYIASFGVQESCVYFAAKSQTRTGVILTNALVLFLLQSAIAIPLGYFLLPRLLAEQPASVIAASRFLLITTCLGLLALYGASTLRARLEMGLYNTINLIIPLGSMLGILWFVLRGELTLTRIVWLYVALYVLLLSATLAALFAKRLWNSFRTDRGIMKQMVRYGAKVQIGGISQLANLRLDQMLMAAFLPAAQLGLYVVAVSIASITTVLPSAIRTVTAPRVAQDELSTQDIPGLQVKLRSYWTLNVIGGMVMLCLTPFAIELMFGSEFRPAILAAMILILASMSLGGKDMLIGPAYGLGAPTLVSQAEVVSLIVTGVTLVTLLPIWGIVGAATASLAAYTAAFFFLALRLKKVHGISPKAVFWLNRQDFAPVFGLLHRFLAESIKRIWHPRSNQSSTGP